MATLWLRWRFFWSRRSRRRTLAALVFALLALLATAYLALPTDGRRQVTEGLASILQGIRSFGLNSALEVGVAICVVVSLALILSPSYRHHSYLATTPSIIPPVSVYLDAENQLSEASIRPFTEFLIKHLDGRRADLLYFLDASQMAKGDKYKTLYRFGFRPVDVPHDPTGQGAVKEAVDRELAMHAYERAVLGPPEQEFVIITGDADFVPLIYRLVALGHSVQIWASPVREAYRVVETYLGVNVIDLGEVIVELAFVPGQSGHTVIAERNKRRPARKLASRRLPASLPARIAAPASLSAPGEQKLYYAIAGTLDAYTRSLKQSHGDQSRLNMFHSILGRELGPRLSGVGYSIGNRLDYWIDHLVALHVLEAPLGHTFPKRGATMADDAAHCMFVMAQATATAVADLAPVHEDGTVRMSDVAAALEAMSADLDEAAAPLFQLLRSDNSKRATHARYFVRCAGALELLVFENVTNMPDIIRHPRLALPVPESGGGHVTEALADETDEAVPMNTEPGSGDASVLSDVVTPLIVEKQWADTTGEAAGGSL